MHLFSPFFHLASNFLGKKTVHSKQRVPLTTVGFAQRPPHWLNNCQSLNTHHKKRKKGYNIGSSYVMIHLLTSISYDGNRTCNCYNPPAISASPLLFPQTRRISAVVALKCQGGGGGEWLQGRHPPQTHTINEREVSSPLQREILALACSCNPARSVHRAEVTQPRILGGVARTVKFPTFSLPPGI